MQPIVLAGAALAFAIFASASTAQPLPPERPPATAQPAGPGEPASPTVQSTPDAPEAQPLPEPPPFPPMPRARPTHRFTTSAQHRTAHVQHRTTHVEHRTARHTAAKSQHRSTHARHEKSKRHQAAKVSPRTIRMCHRLTYTKIMRNSSCRALMSQELKESPNRHHKAAHRHRKARSHETAKTKVRHSKRHRS